MRQSRYTWLMLICMVCLLGTIAWAGPQTSWSALASGNYTKDSKVAVQHFWNVLDARQTELAYAMFDENGLKSSELAYWIDLVRHDPLIRLQKTEILDVEESGILRTRVSWINEEQVITSSIYQFTLINTGQGWKISEFKKIGDELSVVEGIKNEQLLANKQRNRLYPSRA